MKKIFIPLLFLALVLSVFTMTNQSQAKRKNYTVKANQKVTGRYAKSKDLNANTKHYFLLRSYMDKLEKNGGGTLTLKKGTYKITNILYVPSNVTINFEDGVKLIKWTKMGSAKFKAAEGIFQVVPYKLSQKKKKGKAYSGSRNVKFIGKGNVTMDLKYIKNSKAIVTAHCQNVVIDNITFLHMNTGHFLEVDATKNLVVKNCHFSGVSSNSPYTKEAINIDTPDPITGGVNLTWSSLDKTPERDITIENCKFSKLKRGIGTHKYSQKKVGGKWTENCYHENISIKNNTFDHVTDTGIFMLNWRNVTIAENTFDSCTLSMNFRGVVKPVSISHNVFKNSPVTQTFTGEKQNLYYMGYKSPGKGNVYAPIFNDLGFKTLAELMTLNNA